MISRYFSLFILFVASFGASAQSVKPRLDAHGFPLPDGAIARLGDLHFAQPEEIRAIAMSADGKVIVTAGDERVFVWDADTRRIRHVMKNVLRITALAISKDGRWVGVGTKNGEIKLWNATTGKPQTLKTGKLENEEVTQITFLDGERVLGVASFDTSETGNRPQPKSCSVRLIDLESGTLKKKWTGDPNIRSGGVFWPPSFSPSGNLMAWMEGGVGITILETMTCNIVRRVSENKNVEQKIHLLDEGKTLLLQNRGGANLIINAQDGTERFDFHYRRAYFLSRPIGESLWVSLLGVSPDGKSMVTQDEVGIRQWDLTTGKNRVELKHMCDGLAYTADGKRVLVAEGSRLHWRDTDLKPLQTPVPLGKSAYLHYFNDGRLSALDWHGGRSTTWDPKRGKSLENLSFHKAPLVARTPCSYDSSHRLFAHHREKGVHVRDLVTDRDLCRLKGFDFEKSGHVSPRLSPDGKRVLLEMQDQSLWYMCWFDTRNGKELGRIRLPEKELKPHPRAEVKWFDEAGTVFGIVLHDERLVLVDCLRKEFSRPFGIALAEAESKAKSDNGSFPAWQYESAACDRLVLATRDDVMRWAFVGDGSGKSNEYAIWPRDGSAWIRRFALKPDGMDGKYWYGTLSPDGRLLAVYSRYNRSDMVVLYETATARLRGEIQAPTTIVSIGFSPDGQTLATSCTDSTILIWDINRPTHGMPALKAPVNAIEVEALWQTLGEHDPKAMEPALWALVGAPKQTLPVLRQRLQSTRAPARLNALIAQLAATNFKERETATQELAKVADFAIPALKVALAKGPAALEQRRRIEQLLERLESPSAIPPCLRELRGLEVLERIGGAEARAIVEAVASGDSDALVTREARVVLARWQT